MRGWPQLEVGALLFLLTAGFGCGDSGTGPANTCPNDVPTACTGPSPSYSQTVEPVLANRCGACHTAGGVEAVHSFDSYEQVVLQKTRILSQVHACMMPPADQAPLTSDERQVLFTWIVCDTPDN